MVARYKAEKELSRAMDISRKESERIMDKMSKELKNTFVKINE